MKTLSLPRTLLVFFCFCFTVSAAETSTNNLVDPPTLQVTIKARFIESRASENLGIKFSCATAKDSLDFLDGVSYVSDIFTVTNTEQSVSAFNLHKLNGKKTKAVYKAKGPDEKHMVLLKLKKGMLSGKIKNRNGFLSQVPRLTGIPLTTTDGEKTKKLNCKLNILNEIFAVGEADIRYTVNRDLIILIKPVIIKDKD